MRLERGVSSHCHVSRSISHPTSVSEGIKITQLVLESTAVSVEKGPISPSNHNGYCTLSAYTSETGRVYSWYPCIISLLLGLGGSPKHSMRNSHQVDAFRIHGSECGKDSMSSRNCNASGNAIVTDQVLRVYSVQSILALFRLLI